MPKMQTDSTKITPSRIASARVEKRGSSGWPGSCLVRDKLVLGLGLGLGLRLGLVGLGLGLGLGLRLGLRLGLGLGSGLVLWSG